MVSVKDPKKITPPASRGPRDAHVDNEPPKAADYFSFDLNNFYRIADEIHDKLEEEELERNAQVHSASAKLTAELGSMDTAPDDNRPRLRAKELMAKGVLTLGDVMRIDPQDREAMSMRMGVVTDYEAGRKYYLVGKGLETYEARRAAEGYLRQPGGSSGKQETHFEVRTPLAVQSDLVASINRAARITGVPPAMLGALAGIESGFNNPNMQVSPTGAIGVVQQTGGYRDTVWKKYGHIVAQHVPEAREAMKDGLTNAEMRKLAFNEDAAFIIVGLRAKELEKKYGLDLNSPRGMAVVYLEHNSGEGSVQRLLNGKMTDDTIRGYNPAIYKGNDTPEAVFAATERKMVAYGKTFTKMESGLETAMAAAKPAADAAIAKASASSKATVAKADLPVPEPKPV